MPSMASAFAGRGVIRQWALWAGAFALICPALLAPARLEVIAVDTDYQPPLRS